MALIGSLLKKGIRLRESIEQEVSSPIDLQKQELKKLLIHARHTEFGVYYDFDKILGAFKSYNNLDFYNQYKAVVPVFDYDKIHDLWWHKTLDEKKNICWPGKIKFFALSSGTSGSSSKHIPVSKDILKSMKKTALRQILSLSRYDLPDKLYTKGIMMLGGTTSLQKHGSYFEGDLSGITASQVPPWLSLFYKPGKKIARTEDWGQKLDEITVKAKNWDIGIIVGVPAWLQLLMEKIIAHYKVNTIHDIWPNLTVFVHGGVSFEPYKKGFEKLLSKPLTYMETYLASEGFIAFQAYPDRKSMRLVLNNGIFYEFVQFNDTNFDSDGQIRDQAMVLKIDEVQENVDYALLLTTNSGTWRYMIGDTIRFISKEESEIIITGRIKHFLSLCGEHLSVDNMNKAIELTAEELNIRIREFTVAGEKFDSMFAHRWYIGTDDNTDPTLIKDRIDLHLCELNDDYKTERQHALKDLFVELLPNDIFYGWLKANGKEGGQNKFPRVLKNEKLQSWQDYLAINQPQ